jgi:hypothetical protein
MADFQQHDRIITAGSSMPMRRVERLERRVASLEQQLAVQREQAGRQG